MKKLHILSLASALVIGTATAGFAATSSDSTGGSSREHDQPIDDHHGGSGQHVFRDDWPGRPVRYAEPGAAQRATVGPTGSMTRDATTPTARNGRAVAIAAVAASSNAAIVRIE